MLIKELNDIKKKAALLPWDDHPRGGKPSN
jgi:hypothetical protein